LEGVKLILFFTLICVFFFLLLTLVCQKYQSLSLQEFFEFYSIINVKPKKKEKKEQPEKPQKKTIFKSIFF